MELSLTELWATMGAIARAVVVLLALMSVATLAVAAERGWILRRMRRESDRFLEEWRVAASQEGYPAALRVAVEFPASPIARAIDLATRALLRAPSNAAGLDAAGHAVRRASLETATEARRGLALLATVGSTAPFVGLFGTVVGIVNAFQTMAATGQGGLTSVSAGIAEALVATALGILVAIPAVWIFNALTQATTRILSAVEAAGEELVEAALAPEARPPARKEAARGNAG